MRNLKWRKSLVMILTTAIGATFAVTLCCGGPLLLALLGMMGGLIAVLTKFGLTDIALIIAVLIALILLIKFCILPKCCASRKLDTKSKKALNNNESTN